MNDERSPGLGVDAAGNPVVDPTRNVLQLVEAAVARLDNLRTAEANAVREVMILRADYETRLREREAAHAHELRVAEKDRLDAIRSVDVEAVAAASSAAEARATTLAKQVSDSAEAMRSQAMANATASDLALKAALEPLHAAIAGLQQFQYEAVGGKHQVTENRSVGDSRGAWIATGFAILFSVVSAMIAAIALATRGA